MEIGETFDSEIDVPTYMLWCAENPSKEPELVFDYTLDALEEYGRCKDPANTDLNFKYRCSPEQVGVVVSFLSWCESELQLVDKNQISRALDRWSSA